MLGVLALAQEPDFACLQKARQLGAEQTNFLDEIDKAFHHPGTYVDPTPLTDRQLIALYVKAGRLGEAGQPPMTAANVSLLVGAISFDSVAYPLSRAEQLQFGRVIRDIEAQRLWQQLENLMPAELLRQLTEYARTLTDVKLFLPSARARSFPFRNGAVLVKQGAEAEYRFHIVGEMRKKLAAQPADLKLYNQLVDELREKYNELPSGKKYKRIWLGIIGRILSDKTPASARRPTVNFLKKYYRLIDSGPAEIEKQMLDLLQTISQRLRAQQSPIQIAAYAHQRLVDIHPFEDGNGRVARLLMNLVLRSAGYPSISMISDIEYTQHLVKSLNAGDDRIFENYLATKLCHKVKYHARISKGYGKDVYDLVKSCTKKAQALYFTRNNDKSRDIASLGTQLIQECKASLAVLLGPYNGQLDYNQTASAQLSKQEL